MPIDYEVYKPIQTRLNNQAPNPNRGTFVDVSVFNQEHPNKVRRDFLTNNGLGNTPDPLIDSIQTRQAQKIVKAADTPTLQKAIQELGASRYTKEAAIGELQNRGVNPNIKPSPVPSFPTTNSTSAQQATQQALQQIGLSTPATGGVKDFARQAAPTVLGMALNRFVVEPLGEAFSRNITTPLANKVDEALGLAPDPKAREALQNAQQKLDNAIAQRKARNADNAKLNNFADPIKAPPPFTGGQMAGVVYDITFTQTHPDPNYQFASGERGSRQVTRTDIDNNIQGAITGFGTRQRNDGFFGLTTIPTVSNSQGITKDLNDGGGALMGVAYTYSNFQVKPQGGITDIGGNLPTAIIDPNPDKREKPSVPEKETWLYGDVKVKVGGTVPDIADRNWQKASAPFSGLPFADPTDEEDQKENKPDTASPKLKVNPSSGFPQIAPTFKEPPKPAPFLANLNRPSGLPPTNREQQQWIDTNQAIQDKATAKPPEAPKNTTPTTPISNNNPSTTDSNIGQAVAQLLGLTALVAALKVGSDALVNASIGNTAKINEIAQNTTNEQQKNNTKGAVCEIMQPDQCGYEGVKQATTEATAPIKDQTVANAGLLANILAAIANLASTIATLFSNVVGKLEGIKEFLERVWSNQAVDKVMQYITMVTTIHNAAMLSRSLADTLGSVFDQGLQIFGLQLKDKDGNQIGVTQLLGTSFANFVKGIIGEANYTALTNTWVQANRIYQTGINLISNVQNILDSTTAVAELTNNRVATLMNALRSAGAVRENAYTAQSENVTKFNAFMNKLENLEQGTSNLASITGNIVSVQQSVNELKSNRQEFENALKDKPLGTGLPENTPQKESDTQKKEQSVYTIGDFSIVRPPETP